MELIDALFDLCKSSNRPIIAIDGPAGAGKTTLADHLGAALSLKYSVATLHMDDFYNGWELAFDQHLSDTLRTACTSHQQSTPFSLARYDWHKSAYGAVEKFPQSQLLILEGVGSSQIAIRPFLSASIWIDIDPAIGLERVLLRDGESISTPMQRWLELQAQHFLENDSQNAADFVLSN